MLQTKQWTRRILGAALLVCTPWLFVHAEELTFDSQELKEILNSYETATFSADDGGTLPYRLFKPAEADEPLPLVVFLHGAGGIGTENRKSMGGGNVLGSRMWALSQFQSLNPCFVFVPQAPSRANAWTAASGDLTLKAIESLIGEHPIDPGRIYLTGQSLGGIGAWHLLAKHPQKFAAVVPLCGLAPLDQTQTMADSPTAVWAFHGALDSAIPVVGPILGGREGSESLVGSRTIIEALREAGGNPTYTEYPDVAHSVWEKAYRESELITWLFDQRLPPSDAP